MNSLAVIPSEVEAATQPQKLSGRGQAFNPAARPHAMTSDATPKLLRLHFDQCESSHGLVYWRHEQPRAACQRTFARIRKRIRSAVQCAQLIYFEAYSDPRTAIAREKQLKHWSRAKKEALIARRNPEWRDLFEQMYALQPCNDSR
jgi:predicted GIY-YIG superfamily endonuclease